MKAKKLLAALLTVTMIASLTACGGEKTPSPTAGASDPVTPTVSWPGKNLTIYVPNKAGSNNDLTARVFATYLQKAYGTNVTVMNNGDGGGITAYEEVRNAKPDGATLLWQHAGLVISYWTGAYEYEATPENFTPLGWLSTSGPSAYCAQANAPYNNLDELFAYMEDHPDEVRLGVKLGNATHVTACQIENAMDVKFKMVDGSDDASRLAGLLGDNMDVGTMNVKTAEQYVETGDLKIICTTAPYGEYDNAQEWNGGKLNFLGGAGTIMWGPGNMDAELVEQINKVMAEACEDKDVVENLTSMGQVVGFQGAQETADYIAQENINKKEACTSAGINVR